MVTHHRSQMSAVTELLFVMTVCLHYFMGDTLGVTQRSLDQWLGEDEVGMMVKEGPSTTCPGHQAALRVCGVYCEQ